MFITSVSFPKTIIKWVSDILILEVVLDVLMLLAGSLNFSTSSFSCNGFDDWV